MAASLWSTGTAHLYLQPPSLLVWRYLGTAERAPVIALEPTYRKVHADGQNWPLSADKVLLGEQATITALLTRWDETTYAFIANRLDSLTGGRGTFGINDIGTMMIAESQTYQLFVQFPFADNVVYQGMPQGYLFPYVTIDGPEVFDTIGTEGRKLLCIFDAIEGINDDDDYVLYSTTQPNGLPEPT